jgi:cytochrome b
MAELITPVRVWDLPTRLFHWLLVVLIGISWWSAEQRAMEWHVLSGLAVMALVLFRLIWGFAGGSTARFSQFLRSPGAVLAYLRGGKAPHIVAGHNPVGGYSTLAMLLLLALQIGTGLFAVDVDGIDSGPLSFLVSFDAGRTLAAIHELSFKALQLVVALHIVAVLFYLLVRKRNLISPMFSGSDGQIESAAGALRTASPVRFLIAALVSAALAWLTSKGFFL